MKFFLTIAVCSFLDTTCTPPITYPNQFNSWNDCMYYAYKESGVILKHLNQDMVEKNKLATKFTCEEVKLHGVAQNTIYGI